MLVRWLHVVAGIAWIGSSLYFIWLDHSLEPPAPGSDKARAGVAGELWAVHGGGFYNPQKYAVAPAALPERLHWFKWEAYTTWMSGTALLVLVYWLNAGTMMINPEVAGLSPARAVGLAAASLIASWLVYDGLCRSPLGRRDAAFGLVIFAYFTALAWVLGNLLGGRAAYIQVGASIGTVMAANVFFVIIPGQKRLVAAMREGRPPDPRDGRRGKQRSVHNNYFTLPVVFIMLSNHSPLTYGHAHAWAVLGPIGGAGVLIRHFFNLRHRGVHPWPCLAGGALLLAAAAWWTTPRLPALPAVAGPATLARVQGIVGQRCVTCHSTVPTFPGITQPPAGVVLTSPDRIVQNAQRIYQQVVVTRIMPLGNATHATDEERAVIAAWVREGAHP
jgi:uncharacterized membrane protein